MGVNVTHLTPEAVFLVKVVGGEDGGKRLIFAKQAGFGCHHQLIGAIILDGVLTKRR